MKRLWGLILLLVMSGLTFAEDRTASEILEEMDRVLSPDRCMMEMRMITHKPGRSDREMTMMSYYDVEIGTLIEVLSPARTRGTRFLQLEDALWMYTPRSRSSNAIRLSPRDAFQGSTFSNNDISDHNYADDYSSILLEPESLDHDQLGTVRCLVIEGTARSNEAPYGRIKVWILEDSLIPLRMEYYTRSGLLYRTLDFDGIREMGGRRRPTRIRVESTEEEGSYSLLEYLSMDVESPFSDRIFSQSYLTR